MQLITIPHNRGIRLVQAEQIIRVEGLSNYSKIHFTTGQPLTVAKVLHWFEDHLPQQMFARVHRSHLVNKLFVQEINGANYSNLLLTNGESISMSRRKKVLLMTG
ncbi:MAG: LytTR family DNA-binding domain-containing protein [Chitinophagaceae bacterium]